ncbi:universal stress protein, partial [Streptomyces broussonetiae]|uniref:universal stress protein n=1 Tax=Streptomyces broussonetiae TaxID=2686304 RepID=UPI0035DACE39
MERPLVVGVGGSDSSLQAVDWAADETARHGLPLRLVHASLWERHEGARDRVVVGAGARSGGAGAVRFAVREAEVRGCALTAVRAWRTPTAEPVDHILIADDAARLREEQASTGLDEALRL